jgi:hypothetical protein
MTTLFNFITSFEELKEQGSKENIADNKCKESKIREKMTEKYTQAATNPRGVALSGARGSVPRRGGHRPDWNSQHRANASACTT